MIKKKKKRILSLCHDWGLSLDSTSYLTGTKHPIFFYLFNPRELVGIRTDVIQSYKKSKRLIIWTVYDFRRHLSPLPDIRILVISTISRKLLIPPYPPILETVIALHPSAFWFSKDERKCQVSPGPQLRAGSKDTSGPAWENGRVINSSLRIFSFFFLRFINLF